jgi:glycosyltransferase involved in cell wall biosynthesis
MASDDFRLSIVVPLKDEESNVDALCARLAAVLEQQSEDWEVILVDDGSRDTTYARTVDVHRSDPRFKIIRLSRSFGHQLALSAGLDAASGDAVITMDGDLQHPPEVIPELVARWRAGANVVYGVMTERQGESRFKAVTAKAFYGTLTRLADIDVPSGAGDFRLVDRTALDAYRAMRESHRYLRGMFSWVGFEQAGVGFVSPRRTGSHSKYSTGRMIRLATDGIVSFSDRPLRLALNLGFLVSIASIVFGLSALVSRLAGVFVVPGWTSIMVLVGVVGGIQLIVIGIIGEYVSRIHDEVKRRPLYIVARAHGLELGPLPPWR